jgi:hypothetical protein
MENSDIQEFIKSLTAGEKRSMETAKRLLTMTFDIKRSNAFLQWKKKQNLQ